MHRPIEKESRMAFVLPREAPTAAMSRFCLSLSQKNWMHRKLRQSGGRMQPSFQKGLRCFSAFG